MKTTKKNLRKSDGAAVVEFAILLPVLVIIIFGMIEFGLLMFDKQVITNASREGARAGIVQSNPKLSVSEIQAIVNNYCQDNLITFGAAAAPTTTVTGVGGKQPANLTVTVTYNYDFLILPNFVGSLADGVALTAITVMRHE